VAGDEVLTGRAAQGNGLKAARLPSYCGSSGSSIDIGCPCLGVFVLVVTVTAYFVIAQASGWNLLSVDEQWAASRGVNVQSLVVKGYVSGSVLTAAAIALTGPIGFVGLIVPHIVRARISSDHRILMPCAFLLGGTLLALCDALGRVVLAPAEVPAGVTLALLGGPYLVWLVRERI